MVSDHDGALQRMSAHIQSLAAERDELRRNLSVRDTAIERLRGLVRDVRPHVQHQRELSIRITAALEGERRNAPDK
jgi:hypothetical protein